MNKITAEQYTLNIKKIINEGSTYYVATVEEFGNSLTISKDSVHELIDAAYEEIQLILDECELEGKTPPELAKDMPWKSYNGKLNLNIPKSLHYKLYDVAQDEQIDINTLAASVLSEYVGSKKLINEIYIVKGRSGAWEDWREWTAGVFGDHAKAVDFCNKLNQWCQEHGVDVSNDDELDLINPFDSNFNIDSSTGTSYSVCEPNYDEKYLINYLTNQSPN